MSRGAFFNGIGAEDTPHSHASDVLGTSLVLSRIATHRFAASFGPPEERQSSFLLTERPERIEF
jgi:hypothetical protein